MTWLQFSFEHGRAATQQLLTDLSSSISETINPQWKHQAYQSNNLQAISMLMLNSPHHHMPDSHHFKVQDWSNNISVDPSMLRASENTTTTLQRCNSLAECKWYQLTGQTWPKETSNTSSKAVQDLGSSCTFTNTLSKHGSTASDIAVLAPGDIANRQQKHNTN